MTASPSPSPSSASAATVVRTGARSLAFGLPGCLLLVLPGVLALSRLVRGGVTPRVAVVSAALLVPAVLGVLGVAALWRHRHATFGVDADGLWLTDRGHGRGCRGGSWGRSASTAAAGGC